MLHACKCPHLGTCAARETLCCPPLPKPSTLYPIPLKETVRHLLPVCPVSAVPTPPPPHHLHTFVRSATFAETGPSVHFYVLGTALVLPEEAEPTKGRIIVLQVREREGEKRGDGRRGVASLPQRNTPYTPT